MKHWQVALLLFFLGTTTVVVNQRQVGVVRDESVYMYFGARYADFWTRLVTFKGGVASREGITRTFGGPNATDGNREHPPLTKTLFGLSKRIVSDRLHLMRAIEGFRLPSAIIFGCMLALLYGWTARVWGRAEGVVAALFMLLQPRAFFHASLATFDVPIMFWWFLTLYCYWRALSSNRFCVLLGLCFGCALATKHNAWLLPGVVGPHFLWWSIKTRSVRWQVPVAMALLGPLVLFALWPWLWFDTVAHVRDWIVFHTQHVNYNYEYLGTSYYDPPFPFHVVFVTTLLVLPVVTLLSAGFGAYHSGRQALARGVDPTGGGPLLLMLLSMAVAMGVFLLPKTPIFGAEKHFMPAFPTLCVLGGVGLVAMARRAAAALANLREKPAICVLAAAAMMAAGVETFHAQPYALSHYNALAGGAPGGADLGMNRQFWVTPRVACSDI